jgi:hypothetical protein
VEAKDPSQEMKVEGCGFHVAFRGDVHWDIMGYRGFLYWGLPKNGWFVMQHPIF